LNSVCICESAWLSADCSIATDVSGHYGGVVGNDRLRFEFALLPDGVTIAIRQASTIKTWFGGIWNVVRSIISVCKSDVSLSVCIVMQSSFSFSFWFWFFTNGYVRFHFILSIDRVGME
jgi:hypothetical protein